MPLPRSLGALGALVLVLTACSASGSIALSPAPASAAVSASPRLPFVPVIISSEQVVGKNRFLIGLLDINPSTTSIGGPDTKVLVAFTDKASSAAPPTIPSQPARFVWAIQGERGIYVVDVEFPNAGDWAADITATGGGVSGGTVEVQFQVAQTGHAIPVGAKAPDVTTPTLADVGGDPKKLSTDQHPDPAFYTTSVDQAIARHQPFVLVFATPALCTSRQCGPTLDGVKAVAKGEPGVTFINVEPYKLQYANGQLQPVLDANSQLQATDVTHAWGILSEPWVFVVDRQGIVRASFEAVISPAELTAAIDAAKG
jgi:hypothetical protein